MYEIRVVREKSGNLFRDFEIFFQKAHNAKFTIPKFQFFAFVVGLSKTFLLAYQSDWPMIPYFYDDLNKLGQKLLELFVKAEVFGGKSNYDLQKMTLHNDN